MSAICGQFNLNGEPANANQLEAVLAALADYGGDGKGGWQNGAVTLGWQHRHNTPDTISEKQPYQMPGLVIVANGRLDNRQALCDTFSIPQLEQPMFPDSQLILLAYQRWGTDCARHLLGDFAFAIWDKRQHQLFCARDILGVYPFYYSYAPNRFAFASSIDGMLAFPFVQPQLDLRSVRTLLENNFFHSLSRTCFADIVKLPPAHTLLVTPDGLALNRYWSPHDAPTVRFSRESDYQEQLLALLEEAIGCRMRSAYPVGAHASGGLDSSTIAVLAARKTAVFPFHAFSWAPPPTPQDYPLQDERADLETLVEIERNIQLHYTTLTAPDVLTDYTNDQARRPQTTLIWERVASRQAEALGVRTILSGWGGDEVPAFNGRGYFAHLFLRARWWRLWRELHLRARIHEWSVKEAFRNDVILPLLSDSWLRRLRPHSLQLNRPFPLPTSSLQPDFARQLQKVEPYPVNNARQRPGVRQTQIMLLENGHLTRRTEAWAAHGAKHGIEYRYPLLDQRLIEFCLGLPPEMYFQQGWKRYLFRRATADALPKSLRWKKMKSDPAMQAGATEAFATGAQLTMAALEAQRNKIQAAGFVDPTSLLAGMAHPNEASPEAGEAYRALWLAFLHADTFAA